MWWQHIICQETFACSNVRERFQAHVGRWCAQITIRVAKTTSKFPFHWTAWKWNTTHLEFWTLWTIRLSLAKFHSCALNSLDILRRLDRWTFLQIPYWNLLGFQSIQVFLSFEVKIAYLSSQFCSGCNISIASEPKEWVGNIDISNEWIILKSSQREVTRRCHIEVQVESGRRPKSKMAF